MSIKFRIIDFDGTMTSGGEEEEQFISGFKSDLANELKITQAELEKKWAHGEFRVDRERGGHGWEIDEQIVAFAQSNYMAHTYAVHRSILRDEGYYDSKITELINDFYRNNYNPNLTNYRPEAKEFISSLNTPFIFVTNSSTDSVKTKLETLGINSPVQGNSLKFIIDNEWTEIPESVEDFHGSPILLRRKHYFKILQSIMKDQNLKPWEVQVIGDIYEMDLSLPKFMEMDTVYIGNTHPNQIEMDDLGLKARHYITNLLEVHRLK